LFEYLDNILNKTSKHKCFLVALSSSLLLGVLDYIIGAEYSFSVFYIMPIMVATWYGGTVVGIFVAILSSVIWLFADIASGQNYSNSFIPVWNTLVRLGFFLVILRLLDIVHSKLLMEENLADTDALTGLSNRRFFQEQLDREYTRICRTSEHLTIAFIDIDNFKYVNDTSGHEEGDKLLQSVAETLSSKIRATDFAARIGGDEFVILLPVIEAGSVKQTMEKLQQELLNRMKEERWPVTFSIGVITFLKAMDSSRAMIKTVDDLMYEVKKSGKNNVRHLVWPEDKL